jgi:hypothetical protein
MPQTAIPAGPGGDLEASRALIQRWQLEARPLGMPPEQGLLYQPIPFPGYEDLACERDSSDDRFEMISRAVMPRGESLLDLGCANGFFPFRFAQQEGALRKALGVDHFVGNVKTGNHLAERHGLGDRVTFRQGEVSEALLDEVLEEERTLALLLSVHHHIIREHGIETTRRIFKRLHDRVSTVVIEQGSLTQAEYETWTGRTEPFHTRAFSRLVSMAEAAGIPVQHCFLIGMGRYASGRKEDRDGAGRVIVGLSQRVRAGSVLSVQRKAHKNGIFMELLTVAGDDGQPSQVWKNVVVGAPLSQREATALRALANEPGFVRISSANAIDEADGLVRLGYEPVTSIDDAALARHGASIRAQAVERLMALAKRGWVHGELHAEHVVLRSDGTVIVLDFESARHVAEDFDPWHKTVAEPNPALGLDMYPRPTGVAGWNEVDLVAISQLFQRWGVAPLNETERTAYRATLEHARP